MATTTPNYGWDVPTSTDYVKDGATAIETLGDDIDAFLGTAFNNKLHPGLVLLKAQTITNGVTSVSVTNAFSATYDSYRVVINGGGTSTDVDLVLQLTGATGSNYKYIMNYASHATATTPASVGGTNTFFAYVGYAHSANGLHLSCDLHNPFLSKYTFLSAAGINGSSYSGNTSGFHNVAASYSGLTLGLGGAGTFTGGTVLIYGYAKD